MTVEEVGQEDGTEKPLTTARRIELAERDLRSHARSLSEIIRVQTEQHAELHELREWRVTRMMAEVREDERDKALSDRLSRMEEGIRSGIDSVKKDVQSIRSAGYRVFWIAMGTIVPAAIIGVALVLVFGVKLAFPGSAP